MLMGGSQPSHARERQAVALPTPNSANRDTWSGQAPSPRCRLPTWPLQDQLSLGIPGWAVLTIDQGNPSAEDAELCRPTCPSKTSLAWAPSTKTRAVACLPIPVELRDALSLRTRIGVPSSRASSTARPANIKHAWSAICSRTVKARATCSVRVQQCLYTALGINRDSTTPAGCMQTAIRGQKDKQNNAPGWRPQSPGPASSTLVVLIHLVPDRLQPALGCMAPNPQQRSLGQVALLRMSWMISTSTKTQHKGLSELQLALKVFMCFSRQDPTSPRCLQQSSGTHATPPKAGHIQGCCLTKHGCLEQSPMV